MVHICAYVFCSAQARGAKAGNIETVPSSPHVFEHSAVVKADPPQKNRRIPGIDNVQREAGRCMRKSFSIIQESTCS